MYNENLNIFCVIGRTFDAILFDVDSKDLKMGMSCPPPAFMTSDVLANVKTLIGNQGLFILNLVCRDEHLRDQTLIGLKSSFPTLCSYKLDEDVNEIIYCTNSEKYTDLSSWKKGFGLSGRKLNDTTKTKRLCKDDVVDLMEFLNELKI